jgi:hypothetical protein
MRPAAASCAPPTGSERLGVTTLGCGPPLDRLDAHEPRLALRAARAHEPRDLLALAQAVPAYERAGHVGIAVRAHQTGHAHEAVPVGHEVEHARAQLTLEILDPFLGRIALLTGRLRHGDRGRRSLRRPRLGRRTGTVVA